MNILPRRRKSSCPDTLAAANSKRDCVNLDLYIVEDELFNNPRHRTPSPTNLNNNSNHHSHHNSTPNNIEEQAEEVLVLRLLSAKTKYRFGGLQVQIISPIFSVQKLFNVEFDQDSQVSLIKSQQSNLEEGGGGGGGGGPESKSSSQGSIDPRLNGAKSATIVVSPDTDDCDTNSRTNGLSTISADLTLFEEPSRSPKKPLHVSAHSLLTKTQCNSVESADFAVLPSSNKSTRSNPVSSVHPPLQAAASSASDHSGSSVKFENVKVYANLDRIESYDLETKDIARAGSGKKSGCKSKIASMRRHTHYQCYIPSSVSQAATHSHSSAHSSNRASTEDLDSEGRRGTIRRFVAKKVSDTWHSAVKAKRNIFDSISLFNSTVSSGGPLDRGSGGCVQ